MYSLLTLSTLVQDSGLCQCYWRLEHLSTLQAAWDACPYGGVGVGPLWSNLLIFLWKFFLEVVNLLHNAFPINLIHIYHYDTGVWTISFLLTTWALEHLASCMICMNLWWGGSWPLWSNWLIFLWKLFLDVVNMLYIAFPINLIHIYHCHFHCVEGYDFHCVWVGDGLNSTSVLNCAWKLAWYVGKSLLKVFKL